MDYGSAERKPSREAVLDLAEKMGVDWSTARFNVDDLAEGIRVEYEHGSAVHPEANVTDDDPLATARIALGHLYEDEGKYYDYYDALKVIESAPAGYWRGKSENYWMRHQIGIYILLVITIILIAELAYNLYIGKNILLPIIHLILVFATHWIIV